jgi:hypothetical protein
MTSPTQIYVGRREAVMAEVSTPDYYPGKYLLQPFDEAGSNWDAEGCDTKRQLKELIAAYRDMYPGIRVNWL